jgi:hypothetical protein
MRPHKLIYAWRDEEARNFRVSLLPPDAPVRPSVAVAEKADVMAIAEKKRATVFWWPVLSA